MPGGKEQLSRSESGMMPSTRAAKKKRTDARTLGCCAGTIRPLEHAVFTEFAVALVA